MRNCNTLNLST